MLYKFVGKFTSIYWREAPLLRQFIAFLPKDGTLADIGAGSGMLAQLIGKNTQSVVTAIDVVDHSIPTVDITLYDGKRLPFEDDSFDVALLAFVLHHAKDPEAVFQEACRVSRSKVIVIEDTPVNTWQKLAWRAWDYSLNHAIHADVHVAHQARTAENWRRFFETHGAKVTDQKPFSTWFPVLKMYQHTAFLLEV